MTRRADLQAIGLTVLSGLLFVAMNSLVKFLVAEHDAVQLLWARYFFHVATVVVLFPTRLGGITRVHQLGVHLGRSVLLLLSTIANFLALVYMPLGEVAAITFTSPIMVAALAVVILKERVESARWAAIAAGFAGALTVVRPLGVDVNPGAAFAAACAAAYALYQVSTRIVREAEPIVSLFFGGIVGVVALSCVVPFFWSWPTPVEWCLFALTGAMGAIGHLLVIMALQRSEASRVAPFTYVQLLWAMLSSLIVFGDAPDLWTLAGAAVIVGSGLYVYRLDVAERRRRADPAVTPSRQV